MILKFGIAVIGAVLFVPVLIAFVISSTISALVSSSGSNINCTLGGNPSSREVAGYTADQLINAAIIVAVGKQMNVPEQGQLDALATAMQESTLTNLDYGDRDSLGLFQQRPSQGWGTPGQIMHPAYAATQFYHHLLAVPGWQQMSINNAAQTVQRSGTPTAYAQHEQTAREILGAVGGATCTNTTTEPARTNEINLPQRPLGPTPATSHQLRHSGRPTNALPRCLLCPPRDSTEPAPQPHR